MVLFKSCVIVTSRSTAILAKGSRISKRIRQGFLAEGAVQNGASHTAFRSIRILCLFQDTFVMACSSTQWLPLESRVKRVAVGRLTFFGQGTLRGALGQGFGMLRVLDKRVGYRNHVASCFLLTKDHGAFDALFHRVVCNCPGQIIRSALAIPVKIL